MSQEQVNQGHWVEAEDEITAANSAPTAVTDGIPKPINRDGKQVTLACVIDVTSGAWTATGKIWGYIADVVDSSGAAVAGDVGWFDTGETFSISGSADSKLVIDNYYGLTIFQRLYVELLTISGTAATFTPLIGWTE